MLLNLSELLEIVQENHKFNYLFALRQPLIENWNNGQFHLELACKAV